MVKWEMTPWVRVSMAKRIQLKMDEIDNGNFID